MPKKPSFQFYPGDWLKDPSLMMCEPATRGIWFDLICGMHELDQSGKITGTLAQLARMARCTEQEMSAALQNLQDTNSADVTERNGKITVVNRRMSRDYKLRESNKIRQKKHRGNDEITDVSQKNNANVTVLSSSSSSSSSSTSVKEALNPIGFNGGGPPISDDGGEEYFQHQIWKQGLKLMMTTGGMLEKQARSFLGKLVKEYGNERLAEALSVTFARNAINPHEFVVAVLKERGQNRRNNGQKTYEEKMNDYAEWFARLEREQEGGETRRLAE